MWFNSLSDGNDISQKYPPIEIVTRQHLDLKKNYKVVFRFYLEAHDKPKIKRNMTQRTHE